MAQAPHPQAEVLSRLDQLKGIAIRSTPGKSLHFREHKREHAANEKYYTLMELVKGKNLYCLLNELVELEDGRETPLVNALKESDKLSLAIQAAKVLQYLHSKGIYHGDYGVYNLMINYDQEVILVSPIDFGASKIMDKENLEECIIRDLRYFCMTLKEDLNLPIKFHDPLFAALPTPPPPEKALQAEHVLENYIKFLERERANLPESHEQFLPKTRECILNYLGIEKPSSPKPTM